MTAYTIDTASTVLSRVDLGLPGNAVSPSGEVQEILLSLWSDILAAKGLGIDDDFFAAGGDSFAAAALITGIEIQLGVSLPVSALISSPTVRLLASNIETAQAGQAHRSLTPVNSRGGGAPVFCVHGMTGEAYATRKLYAALGENRRFYGFRAQGLGDNEKPLASMTAMAERYISEMREVEPDGPYVLAGWCGGALVAYEMAQRLRADGETVAGLVMVDPPVDRDFAPWLHGLKPGFSFREHMRRFDRKLRRGLLLRWKLKTFDRRRYRVEHAFHKGLTDYVPRPYGGPVLILYSEDIRAKMEEAGLDWKSFECPDMRTACVSPRHSDNFDGAVGQLADEVRALLERVAPLEETGPDNLAAS